MRQKPTQMLPAPAEVDHGTSAAVARRLRRAAAHHGEEILREIPATLRHGRRLLLVLTISIPVGLVMFAAVLWHLGSK